MKLGTVQFTSTTHRIVLQLYHTIVGFPEEVILYAVYRSTVSTHLHFYRCGNPDVTSPLVASRDCSWCTQSNRWWIL